MKANEADVLNADLVVEKSFLCVFLARNFKIIAIITPMTSIHCPDCCLRCPPADLSDVRNKNWRNSAAISLPCSDGLNLHSWTSNRRYLGLELSPTFGV